MKRPLAVISFACLILGFQNCSRQGVGAAESSGAVENDVSVAMPSTDQVHKLSQDVTEIEVPNSTNTLVIDAKSGHVDVMDANSQVVGEACLNASDVSDLQALLDVSSLCVSAGASSADQVCSQQYTPAYASLILSGQTVKLGESLDGCGTGRRDFCGQQADAFKGWLANVKANWSSMACAQ
jgi:hypothetical protein